MIQNELLMQFQAELLQVSFFVDTFNIVILKSSEFSFKQVPIQSTRIQETTALGAALGGNYYLICGILTYYIY